MACIGLAFGFLDGVLHGSFPYRLSDSMTTRPASQQDGPGFPIQIAFFLENLGCQDGLGPLDKNYTDHGLEKYHAPLLHKFGRSLVKSLRGEFNGERLPQ